MKYVLFVSVLFALLFSGAVVAQTEEDAQAEEIAEEESVTLEDLGVQDPGMLPTSPFYFLKEFGRGVQSFFAFNAVAKADLEVRFANEKAAELKAVEERSPENEAAIARALSNYQRAQERLASRLESLRETSENPNIDRLLDGVAQRTVLHERLLGEIEERHGDKAEVRARAKEAKERVENVVERIADKDLPEKFAERLEKALEEVPGSTFKHLRSVEFLDKVSLRLPDAARDRLSGVREGLKESLKARIEAQADEDGERLRAILERVPGDEQRRAVLLEEIRVQASDRVANALRRAQEALDQRISGAADRAEKAADQIRHAQGVLARAQEKTREQGDVRAAVQELISQAEQHLASAREAFDAEEYGEAFGQARAAEVIARNALRILETGEEPAANLLELRDKILDRISLPRPTPVPPVTDTGETVVCTQEYNPVCGVDGKTYSNRCVAERQNQVRVAHEGECETSGDEDSSLREQMRQLLPTAPDTSEQDTRVEQATRATRSLEADDNGFYPSSEIRVPKGATVALTFNVRSLGVYFGGLDFRSDKFKTASAKPGGTVTVEFVADESFDFTSWWPASNELKAKGRVVVE